MNLNNINEVDEALSIDDIAEKLKRNVLYFRMVYVLIDFGLIVSIVVGQQMIVSIKMLIVRLGHPGLK